jgi:glycosyltransferase involved in cell wall biosynthesis
VQRPLAASRLYHLEFALRVAADARRRRCDVIQIHSFPQFVPVIRALNPRAKIVLQNHIHWLPQFPRRLVEGWLRKADLLIACSDDLATKIRRTFPYAAGGCRTLYNGIDPERFSPGPPRARRSGPDV